MSDWADGLAEAFAPPATDLGWTSGYDLQGAFSAPSPAPVSFDVLGNANTALRTVAGLVTARDRYQDARLDRSVEREVKVLNAQTAKDIAGIRAQTERINALGGLNFARLQAQPSQLGLGNAANDRMLLLLAAVGVVIAIAQYAKDK